ncbi:unnamed protein product, partial [Musa hybrid cultivar]
MATWDPLRFTRCGLRSMNGRWLIVYVRYAGGSDSALIVSLSLSLPLWVVGIVVGQTREGGAACFLSQSKEDSGTRYVCIYLYR